MTSALLLGLAASYRAGRPTAITSVCSAHPEVIGAALALGRAQGRAVLIEATCNQVNQDGGYTGMQPGDFRRFVETIAARERFDLTGLILGGDHLGPNPWQHLPAAAAMVRASTLVAAYVSAGFSKIHLDASMPCADDPVPLPDATIAARAARLAAVAERHAGAQPPVYVIGTEVPIPGGAMETVADLAVTSAAAARATVALHRDAFARERIESAFDRIVGLVVQPGVEFGNANVAAYDPAAARALIAVNRDLPMCFEAHSTDYQTPDALAALVQSGFGILKVGPGLTFALREALYGLDHIAGCLFAPRPVSLRDTMERLMCARPEHWAKYYPGDPAQQQLQRHFSYSDRIRYYWADQMAGQAVAQLLGLFGDRPIPEPLISQYLGAAYAGVMAGQVTPTAPALLRASVTRVLSVYSAACHSSA